MLSKRPNYRGMRHCITYRFQNTIEIPPACTRLEVLAQIIPSSEAWLYKDKEALESVHKGLKDAAEGRVSKLDLNEL